MNLPRGKLPSPPSWIDRSAGTPWANVSSTGTRTTVRDNRRLEPHGRSVIPGEPYPPAALREAHGTLVSSGTGSAGLSLPPAAQSSRITCPGASPAPGAGGLERAQARV